MSTFHNNVCFINILYSLRDSETIDNNVLRKSETSAETPQTTRRKSALKRIPSTVDVSSSHIAAYCGAGCAEQRKTIAERSRSLVSAGETGGRGKPPRTLAQRGDDVRRVLRGLAEAPVSLPFNFLPHLSRATFFEITTFCPPHTTNFREIRQSFR